MTAPKEIIRLVENFDRHRDEYHAKSYNEEQARADFINPFFAAMKWDVDNKEHPKSERYRDVVLNKSQKEDSADRGFPDYTFRMGGTPVFYVEAKPPSVDIKNDQKAAYQLRRYAWSAKFSLSILTNFEDFAVYDGSVRPHKDDNAVTARIALWSYTQYPQKWEEIANIFSQEAIEGGLFDKFAGAQARKRGTSEVDTEFLADISKWRDELAHNIASRNRKLSVDDLNNAVQRTIDRIIFLRMCEDRGIEPYGQLQRLLDNEYIYSGLLKLYARADGKYNSGLFYFEHEKGRGEPDTLTPTLNIDNEVLKKIIASLYYPDCPYEFRVLPAEILGNVYEQFLGKVIRLTKEHHAKVEEKPEVKKAGGVYYTPKYIVDYIVKNTVGKLCEGKTPKQISQLRILDPACGSGSFLLGAYTRLLDYHRDWYAKRWPKQFKKEMYRDKLGQLHLATAEKKRILLNNVYGVDIDLQAVEVTKLSLLLKVLEGENAETLEQQARLFHERALPDLDNNIKCGNSLIGPDYFAEQLIPDPDEMKRVNPFDWKKEFPEIFKPQITQITQKQRKSKAKNGGGFDCVIGNPPYVRQEALGETFKEYVKSHFHAYAGTADLYVYFFEKAHRLLRDGGYFGMICSNKFMRANYGKPLRVFLAEHMALWQIVDFGELPVFQNAATFPAIFLTRNIEGEKQKFIYAPIKRLNFKSLEDEVSTIGTELDDRALRGDNWTLARREEVAVFEKMKRIGVPLGESVKGQIYRGVLTGLNEAFVIDRETRNNLITQDPKSGEVIKAFVIGDDVRKYQINFKDRYLILIPMGWTRVHMGKSRDAWKTLQSHYPAVARHLSAFETAAKKRCDKGDYWWELRACDYYSEFPKPKIVWPEIAKESRFAFDASGYFLNKTCFFSPTNSLYLVGILNSKVIWFYQKSLCSVLGDVNKGGRLLQQKIYIVTIPIRKIDFSNEADKARHDRMVNLVEQMLGLHKQVAKAKGERERTVIQRQIDSTDADIDKLVYELYGLTTKEIAIVEGK
jgi:type I restriction-modification system DNA methylase subunit/predicted type IV restriction endonuclease